MGLKGHGPDDDDDDDDGEPVMLMVIFVTPSTTSASTSSVAAPTFNPEGSIAPSQISGPVFRRFSVKTTCWLCDTSARTTAGIPPVTFALTVNGAFCE